jgi:hypothetical protein
MLRHPQAASGGSRLAKLLIIPVSVAWLLGMLAAGATIGHEINGTWHKDCHSSEVCIYQDANFGGARAAMAGGWDHGDMDLYQGQYPGTGVNLNDSVSSLQNTYNTYDTTWYYGADFSGATACYDSYTAWSWINFFNNDQFSSHNVHPGDGYC